MGEPSWVSTGNEEETKANKGLWGEALGFGAPAPVLNSKEATLGFIKGKQGPTAGDARIAGLPPLFSALSDEIKKKIKSNSALAIQALFAENQADVARIAERAQQVAATSTRRHFEEAGWILDGLVMYGSTPFTSAFRKSLEGKEAPDPVPYLLKLQPSENELRALARIKAAVKKKYPKAPPDCCRRLVTTKVVTLSLPRPRQVLAMPHYVRPLSDMPALPESHVLLYAKPLFELLQVLWECEIFHCDIKPANFFLDSSGQVFLGDYGSLMDVKNIDTLSTTIFIPKELLREADMEKVARP